MFHYLKYNLHEANIFQNKREKAHKYVRDNTTARISDTTIDIIF